MKNFDRWTRKTLTGLACLSLLTGLVACGSGSGNDQAANDAVIVPPDKTDNYYSSTAQEYALTGQTTISIEPELADSSEAVKMQRVYELIPLKQNVIAWFLTKYLGPKGHDDENPYIKGYNALSKNQSWEEMRIRPEADGVTYTFDFRQEIGGPLDLMQDLPIAVDTQGRRIFDLIIGRITNAEMARLETNSEWYRRAPWSDFNPENVDAGRLETLKLTIEPEERSSDAWIDYQALFADGEVTIGVHFGWDYHNDYHLIHSRAVYDWLEGKGFVSPVSSYDEYTRHSGPLTGTIQADDRSVDAKVWLSVGKPGTETDPDTDAGGRALEDDMRESFRSREVIVYSGHSGPFYAYALANWRKTDEGDLDDSEIPGLDMPSDVYQVVLSEGCETYHTGQMFFENPNKPKRGMVDVITTTSFSNAGTANTVKDFLTAIIGTDGSGNHQAKTYYGLMDDLNSNSWWYNSMYGVHGLDDNPKLHPYANPAQFCESCQNDSDCGPVGYKCAKLGDEGRACFGLCTADEGCPQGFKCMDVASNNYMQSKACVPANLTCSAPPPPPETKTLMINEVLADPPKELAGDANGDGVREGSADEFIELVNYGQGLIDLSGYQITDAVGTRFTFEAGVTLMAGQAVLVFGNGTPSKEFGGSQAFVTKYMLGFNNKGDTISLIAPDGSLVDQMSYAAEGNKDRSLVRAVDGDPQSEWVQHPGSAYSAGTRQDGSAF